MYTVYSVHCTLCTAYTVHFTVYSSPDIHCTRLSNYVLFYVQRDDVDGDNKVGQSSVSPYATVAENIGLSSASMQTKVQLAARKLHFPIPLCPYAGHIFIHYSVYTLYSV